MKTCVVSLFSLAAMSTAFAGTVDLNEDLQLQADLRNRIHAAGYDCPNPRAYSTAGSDYRGQLFRVDCQSKSGADGPSFRIVEQKGQPARVEPW